jgi:hypothetical protein
LRSPSSHWRRPSGSAASLSLSEVSFRRPSSFVALFIQWVWLLGLAVQGVGVALQAAALDRGRLTIIQPLLVTSVIFAMPFEYLPTGQKDHVAPSARCRHHRRGPRRVRDRRRSGRRVDNAPNSDWLAGCRKATTSCAN